MGVFGGRVVRSTLGQPPLLYRLFSDNPVVRRLAQRTSNEPRETSPWLADPLQEVRLYGALGKVRRSSLGSRDILYDRLVSEVPVAAHACH